MCTAQTVSPQAQREQAILAQEVASAEGLVRAARTSGEADWYWKHGVLIHATNPRLLAHALSGRGYNTGPASQEGFLRVYWSK
jgi:hypothetical protein